MEDPSVGPSDSEQKDRTVQVYVKQGLWLRRSYFHSRTVIGSGAQCDVQLDHPEVATEHVEIVDDGQRWLIRDLGSDTGTYVAGERVDCIALSPRVPVAIRFGTGGPTVAVEACAAAENDGPTDPDVSPESLTSPADAVTAVLPASPASPASPAPDGSPSLVSPPASPAPDGSSSLVSPCAPAASPAAPGSPTPPVSPAPLEQTPSADSSGSATKLFHRRLQRDLDATADNQVVIRNALREYKQRKGRRWWGWVAVFGVLLAAVTSYALYQRGEVKRLRGLAQGMFYNMKAMELRIDGLISLAEQEGRSLEAGLAAKRRELAEMQQSYERFVEDLVGPKSSLPPDERIILKVARALGECDVIAPRAFVEEVRRYIAAWRSSNRLHTAMEKLRRTRKGATILNALAAHHLPAQLFFLPLQESNYQIRAVGPPTRFGYAKGLWQLIPMTATGYGLKLGPAVDEPVYDPEDERFNLIKATSAATRYLRDIYQTDAQASGLLVLAAYNWGHNRVARLIKTMPPNPRERNFWRLYTDFDVPRETRDYVLRIFSAAVISEDPAHFGFSFRSPLQGADP